MLFPKLTLTHCTRATCLSAPWVRTFLQKRFVHRTSDYQYLEKGRKNSEYHRIFLEKCAVMQQFPELMERYFRTAAAMKLKGKVPFVHAHNSLLRVPRIFLETLSPTALKDNFRYLRSPSKQFDISREHLRHQIDKSVKDHESRRSYDGLRLDHHPSLKPYLLSVSYSLMSFGKRESAFDFLFSNASVTSREAMRGISNNAIARALQMRGFRSNVESVLKQVDLIYEEYEKLRLGTLFVIGVPNVAHMAYDSKAFGIPTGLNVASVAEKPWESPRAFSDVEGGMQARILLTNSEALNPASGLEVIDVNNAKEVDAFCHVFAVSNPRDVYRHTGIFKHKVTKQEQTHWLRQQRLDDKVKQMALAFRTG